jgi:hypothetical protein
MILMDDDLGMLCGRIGTVYRKHRLSPPFSLRQIATEWQAQGIAVSHIVAVIDRHLSDYRRRYYSGSGDALFSWVDEIIRKTWREQHFSPPWGQATRPTMERMADREWADRQPNADHEVDPKRRPTGQEAPVAGRSDAPGCGTTDQAPPPSAKSIGKKRTGLKRIDHAIAFLRRELADGGLSLRTLDRARAQLNVACRRTGFAKTGKSWLSLSTAPKRRRLGRQNRGKRGIHVA